MEEERKESGLHIESGIEMVRKMRIAGLRRRRSPMNMQWTEGIEESCRNTGHHHRGGECLMEVIKKRLSSR